MPCTSCPQTQNPLITRMLHNFATPIRFVLEWIVPYALALGLMFFGGIAIALACGWKPENVKKKEERESKREGLEGELGRRVDEVKEEGEGEGKRLRVEVECLEEMRRERMGRLMGLMG